VSASPRSGTATLRLGVLGGALVAASLGVAVRAPADEKFMRSEDVKPGMKGYGLTVFQGTTPEKFEVEVISTLKNFRPKQDLIVIKTKHPRLDVARTVAGMSGSPIYLEGKMIGAYAYGWLFGVEPIAGVTPIHDMLADLRRPIPPAIAPSAGRAPLPGLTKRRGGGGRRGALDLPGADSPNRFAGAPLDYDLAHHLSSVGERNRAALEPPAGSGLKPASTDVMVSGVGPRSMRFAEELFEPLGMTVQQGGGAGGTATAPTDGPSRFVDGGVVTVQMLRGDVSSSGLGTVTYVEGDRLVAFGHPMSMGGLGELPTALGRVHWVVATHNRSFKLGEPTLPLGSLVNDRQASIVVDQNRRAPTFPIVVDIRGVAGAPHTHWQMEGTSDPLMAPSITALAIGSALESTAAERGDQTWRATTRLTLADQRTITVEDFGAGSGSPLSPNDFARSRVVRAMGALFNNPWKLGSVVRVDTTVDLVMRRDVSILRSAELLDSEVDAGGTARVRLVLQSHLGALRTEELAIPIARSLAGETVRVEIRPGYTQDRAVPAPESYDQLVDVLDRMDFPGEAIVVSYTLPNEAAASYGGRLAHRVPPGMADMLASRTDSGAPELHAAQAQLVLPMKGFVVGQEAVEIKVRHVLR